MGHPHEFRERGRRHIVFAGRDVSGQVNLLVAPAAACSGDDKRVTAGIVGGGGVGGSSAQASDGQGDAAGTAIDEGLAGRPESPEAGTTELPDCSLVTIDCFAAGCAAHACGTPDSVYDKDMCLRPSCDEGLCPEGSVCKEVGYTPIACGYIPSSTACQCGGLSMIRTEMRCMPTAS